MRIYFILAITGQLLFSGGLTAQLRSVTEPVVAKGVEIVDARFKLAAGDFRLASGRSLADTIALLEGNYDEERFDYNLSFDQRGSRADLEFELESRRKSITGDKTEHNNWKLQFASNINYRFDFEVGACKADFSFDGLTISEFRLNVGAADARFEFPTVNGRRLEDFVVKAGVCDLEILKIGNSRFERLEFEGGVGSFTLDFSGDFSYEAEAHIEVGLGSVEIVVPRDVGVRLECNDNWLNSISFPERDFKRVSRRENLYESENYDRADGRLTLILDVGLGSAKIRYQ